MKQKIWKINFTVPNTNYNIIDYPVSVFIDAIPKKNGMQLMKEFCLEFSEGTITAFVPEDVIRNVAEWIVEKVIAKPEWAQKFHRETEEINRVYFELSKEIEDMDLGSMSNSELYELYNKLRNLQAGGHTHAIATTWFMESDGERYSQYLRGRLEDIYSKRGTEDESRVVEDFITLTTPTRYGFYQEQQIDFLVLLKDVQQNQDVIEIFHKNSVSDIFGLLSSKYQKKIREHNKKWRWTGYGYVGPAYTENHYVEQIKEQIDCRNVDELVKEEKRRNEKAKKKRDGLIMELEISDDLLQFFDIACEVIWLKDFRKYCFYRGHFVIDLINSEVARRLHLTLRQVNHIAAHEYKSALLECKYDEHILNDRIRYSVIYSIPGEDKYFYGEEARRFRQSICVEDVEVDIEKGFQGSCACPGSAKGEVKIVNSVRDMDKIKAGDIMLALTTYPALLPAMKKAAAIVTEDGGITCHASIVSRELNIPCVVGAKKVTTMLEDGDMVEVDATKGIIKKL